MQPARVTQTRAPRWAICRRSEATSRGCDLKSDMANALLADTLAAIADARPDATLRVLECKAAAGETANEVLDLAMRVCGGAAFRKDVAVERFFRDAPRRGCDGSNHGRAV